MILRKIVVLAAVAASLSAFAGGCQSGGVGDPCTPEDEYQPEFSGFAPSEINVELRSFQCETRVCLVNHFRGRVSCPLGQDDYLAQLAHEIATGRVCEVPEQRESMLDRAWRSLTGSLRQSAGVGRSDPQEPNRR